MRVDIVLPLNMVDFQQILMLQRASFFFYGAKLVE